MNKPYTYLIGWSAHNKWYYGVRYKKTCTPDELWRSYFTSSKHVRKFRSVFGEPNIIQVRKIFDSDIEAKNWETKVLTRLNVSKDMKWINCSNNNSFKGITMTPKIIELIKEGRRNSEKCKIKKHAINDGYVTKYIPVKDKVPDGWHLGVDPYIVAQNRKSGTMTLMNKTNEEKQKIKDKISESTKGKRKPVDFGKKISNATKGKPKPWNCGPNNPAKTEAARKKISDSWKNRIIGKFYTDEINNFYIKPGDFIDPSWRKGRKSNAEL